MADYEIRREIDGHHLVLDRATSQRMAGIRRSNTGPELAVRRVLHQLGHRYRVSNRDLPGAPDIANRKKKWAVFVHGCFWHRHSGCPKATTPKRNREFWLEKFEKNVDRDRAAVRALEHLGFVVLVLWECELGADRAIARLVRTLPDPICATGEPAATRP